MSAEERVPLRYTVRLDALDAERATYKGANELQVIIDRAAFQAEGCPVTVTLIVGPDISEPSETSEVNLEPRQDYRTLDHWASGDISFQCGEYPCPECGNNRVIGWYFLNELGRHQHTHYVCTWWPNGGKRCGWHGWSIPDSKDDQ